MIIIMMIIIIISIGPCKVACILSKFFSSSSSLFLQFNFKIIKEHLLQKAKKFIVVLIETFCQLNWNSFFILLLLMIQYNDRILLFIECVVYEYKHAGITLGFILLKFLLFVCCNHACVIFLGFFILLKLNTIELSIVLYHFLFQF